MLRRTLRAVSGVPSNPSATLMATQLAEKAAATKAILDKNTLYSSSVIHQELQHFFGELGLDASYFRVYTPQDIADHVHGFIAAKRMASLSNVYGSRNLFFHIEQPNKLIYFCADDPHLRYEAERALEAEINKRASSGKGYSVRTHVSDGVACKRNCPARLCVYEVTWSDFHLEKEASEFNAVCTKEFAKTKPPEIQERYAKIYADMCKIKKLRPIVRVVDKEITSSGHMLTLVAYSTQFPYMPAISQIAEHHGIKINRKYVEVFKNDVTVHAVYTIDPTETQLKRFNENVAMLGLLPVDIHPILRQAFEEGKLDCSQLLYVHAISTFAYFFTENVSEEFLFLKDTFANSEINRSRLQRMSEKLWKEAIATDRILRLAVNNIELCLKLYEDFRLKASNSTAERSVPDNLKSDIRNTIRDHSEYVIFESFVVFNEHVLKTNFLKEEKSALSFRLDPSFMKKLGYVEIPYGVFYLVGATFTGFHIRFRDIARGGIRLVAPRDKQMHKNALKTLIQENLNLAMTQQRKNKDIPEGGSKGIILVHQENANAHVKQVAYLQYMDALCDVMLPNQQGVLDRYGKPELIFIGPDENTSGDLPDRAMDLARERGYPYYKSFTTGKSPQVGGIPHDLYGMTTTGVSVYKRCIRQKWGLQEKALSKVQTGGPSGDLGGNEIKMSEDKTITIIDGDAVLYDPQGLDRDELMRLTNNRLTARHFNPSCIRSKDGFVVTVEDKPGRVLPDGQVVDNFGAFRDTFHFFSQADFFVPCGGRPRSIDISNVHRMMLNPGDLTGNQMMQSKSNDIANLRYRFIVEGANLFITPEARLALENYGVVLFLDSSANKGGVTSSSLEVLAALAMSPEEHEQLMHVSKEGVPPTFYSKYVAGIHKSIDSNCRREFECIEREYERCGQKFTRSVIATKLSVRINVLNERILQSNMAKNSTLLRRVLPHFLPEVLLERVPLDTLLQRVPEPYVNALFNAYLASDYVYSVGLSGNETSFSQYIHDRWLF